MTAKPQPLVCLGVIVAAHGLRGQVKIKCYTDAPLAIADYGPLCDEAGARRFKLGTVREVKGGLIASIAGVDDRSGAEALRGTRLCVPRQALPAVATDEFYQSDLMGLAAVTTSGNRLGTVVAVHNFGAGDLLELAPAGGGKTMLLPFTRSVVPFVDVSAGRLVVVPPAEVEAGA
jgi:16S rRNA processing protein RimM